MSFQTVAAAIFFIVAAIVAVYLLAGKTKRGSSVDRAYITGEPTVLDEEHGECYILGFTSTDNKTYTYRLLSEKGVVFKDYVSGDLMAINEHLNLVGRQVMITKTLVSKLSGNLEYEELRKSFNSVREQLEQVQSEYADLQANFDNEVQKTFDRAEQLGNAFRQKSTHR